MGKTALKASGVTRWGKHPHARGEDVHHTDSGANHGETPPRTWGRRVIIPFDKVPRGNTPTHVGKTDPRPPRRCTPRKHPHARGEDAGSSKIYGGRTETPPRTWGRPPPRTWGRRRELQDLRWKDGNTPTHVGKTGAAPGRHLPFWKHPHARGEDRHTVEILPGHGETPPRTWGRRKGSPQSGLAGRNTPTHVGKTRGKHVPHTAQEKHPHARGEDSP